MTWFWLFIMVATITCVVGVGYVIRLAVGDMDDEIRYLSPFRHDTDDETV